MGATTMIDIRLDEQVKQEASAALAVMGLSVSDAVRALLVRVAAEKALPFALRVPRATTRAAMAEADEMARARRAHRGFERPARGTTPFFAFSHR
jgi:DNA-damage-inducible protein J